MIESATGRSGRLPWLFAIALLIVLAVILIVQAFAVRDAQDFVYFIVAGRVWATGGDPYGGDFLNAARGLIPADLALWAYPPQWWIVARATALSQPLTAVLLWKMTNVLLMGASLALLGRGWWPAARPRERILFCVAIGLMLTGEAVKYCLILGQTGMVSLLGLTLLLTGSDERSRSRQAFGLAILLMKPQFGLAYLVIALSRRGSRGTGLIALLICVVACLPVLAQVPPAGLAPMLGEWVHNLRAYGTLRWNGPFDLTNVAHLLAIAGWPLPPLAIWSLIGCVVAYGLTRWSGRGERDIPRSPLLLRATSALFAIVPLHIYDLVSFPMLLMLWPRLRRWARLLLAAANLLVWRLDTGILELGRRVSAFGLTHPIMPWSFAATATFLAFIAIVFGFRDQPGPPLTSPRPIGPA